jgi:hypothetical protein
MLAIRIQAIDGARTSTSQDSQLCRLLLVTFDLRLEFDDFRVCGERVLEVAFRGKARLFDMEVAPPVISGYGAPKKNATRREAIVEDFVTLGKTSIAHKGNRISIFLDVSQVQVPPFCLFRYFRTSGEQVMDHDSLELYGIDKRLRVEGKGMTARICTNC